MLFDVKRNRFDSTPFCTDIASEMNSDLSVWFDEKGRLRSPLAEWMQRELGIDARIITQTRFRRVPRLPYHAHTFYKTVRYLDPAIETNATHRYSPRDWLNLFAHELYHRQEIGNNWFSAARFGISYGYHWLKNRFTGKHPYFQNPHEIRAFAIGCDNDSKVNRLWEAGIIPKDADGRDYNFTPRVR